MTEGVTEMGERDERRRRGERRGAGVRGQTTATRRRAGVLAAIVATALLLAGCSGADSGDQSSSAGGDAGGEGWSSATGDSAPDHDTGDGSSPSAIDPESTATADESTDGGGSAQAVALTPADLGRSIVYTATVEIEADDVEATSREAQLRVTALGGLVFGQETTTDPQPRTVLVFKVAPEQFGAALEALSGVGEVVRQDVSADDVTERVVDLQSQIASLEVSVARLRDLLAAAPDLEAIAQLESQLLDRETSLEQLRGQLRTLEAQVGLATITLTIDQPEATPELQVEVTSYVGDDEGARCPGDDELTVDEGTDVVLCLTIENTGNVPLGRIEVRDHSLRLDPDDVTLVDFTADGILAPGEVLTAWAPFTAQPDRHPRPDVTAVALDESGTQLRVGVRTSVLPIVLDVVEDDSLPGFGDAFGAGVEVLATIGGFLVLLAGLAIPASVIVVPIVLVLVWRRRSARRAGDPTPTPTPA